MQEIDQGLGDVPNRIPYAELLTLPDERVMLELLAGNADAFAVVFKRYHRLIYVTAWRIVRDATEAEDLTQSVFLEFYRKAGQFDPAKGILKVWLLQYAYCRSISRRNQILGRPIESVADLEGLERAESLWAPPRLTLQETTRLSAEILAALDEPQRETLRLFFFEGLTMKEIAERRKESFSNVRHHYYRGIERLRSFLENGVEPRDSRQSVVRFAGVRRVAT